MSNERLTTAIKLLKAKLANDANDAIKIDMDTWGVHRGAHPPEEQNFCGTTACALGYLALQPEMQKLGMQASWSNDDRVHAIRIIGHGLGDLTMMDNAAAFFVVDYEVVRMAFLYSRFLAKAIETLESAQ